MTVGRARFWPIGLMPPTTYPVVRSAAAGSAITAFFPPAAAAIAFRSSCLSTGTTPTVSLPSTSTSNVLNTCSGASPSSSAASSPYDFAAGPCSYACVVNSTCAFANATVAGVPCPCLAFATGRLYETHAAVTGRGREFGLQRRIEAGQQTGDQVQVHPADQLRMLL